jgi:hypothetical protein
MIETGRREESALETGAAIDVKKDVETVVLVVGKDLEDRGE